MSITGRDTNDKIHSHVNLSRCGDRPISASGWEALGGNHPSAPGWTLLGGGGTTTQPTPVWTAHLVLAEQAQERAGQEVVPLHGHGQGAAVRGVQQRGHGLQQAHCDARPLGAPLVDSHQLLAQGLLQRQGHRAGAGELPPWAWAQREDLGRGKGSGRHRCGRKGPSALTRAHYDHAPPWPEAGPGEALRPGRARA